MSDGNIAYACQDGVYIVRMRGTIRHSLAGSFDDFISGVADDADARMIILDLADTLYLDSTNLGLLAKIGNLSLTQFDQMAVILQASKDVECVLLSMGFDTVFRFVSGRPEVAGIYHDLPSGLEAKASSELVLHAHKALSNMNERNADRYQVVIDTLTGSPSLS